MSELRKAAQAALEDLEAELHPGWHCNSYHPLLMKATEALRAALAEPQPEPVALQIWCDTCEGTGSVTQESQRDVVGSGGTFECPDCDGRGFNLKTVAAPQAQQPLTNEQIDKLMHTVPGFMGTHWIAKFARAIERAHDIEGEA